MVSNTASWFLWFWSWKHYLLQSTTHIIWYTDDTVGLHCSILCCIVLYLAMLWHDGLKHMVTYSYNCKCKAYIILWIHKTFHISYYQVNFSYFTRELTVITGLFSINCWSGSHVCNCAISVLGWDCRCNLQLNSKKCMYRSAFNVSIQNTFI